jgi:NADPH-dependent 2,4-dienoyl-CoA reductase/sulfur reductase-like enzyme
VFFEPHQPIRCAINPETGQELICPDGPQKRSRRVWVIGAGPAGLVAAYEAARLGHTVTLFEKEKRAGGNLFYSSLPPFKESHGEWLNWLISHVKKMGVDLRTDTCVHESHFEEADCDAVILSTGAEMIFPDVEGIEQPMVCDAWQILDGIQSAKDHVIIVGAGMVGLETADFMTEKGSRVTLIEMLKKSPVKTYTSHGYMLHERLRKKACEMLFDTNLEIIHKHAITVSRNGKKETISGIDQVVLAVGMRPRDRLKKILEAKGIPYHQVGDASEVRRIFEATQEGALAAWNI